MPDSPDTSPPDGGQPRRGATQPPYDRGRRWCHAMPGEWCEADCDGFTRRVHPDSSGFRVATPGTFGAASVDLSALRRAGAAGEELPCGCIPYEHEHYGPCAPSNATAEDRATHDGPGSLAAWLGDVGTDSAAPAAVTAAGADARPGAALVAVRTHDPERDVDRHLDAAAAGDDDDVAPGLRGVAEHDPGAVAAAPGPATGDEGRA